MSIISRLKKNKKFMNSLTIMFAIYEGNKNLKTKTTNHFFPHPISS